MNRLIEGLIVSGAGFLLAIGIVTHAQGAETPGVVTGIEAQPLRAQVNRVAQTLEALGSPLSAEQKAAVDKLADPANPGDIAPQVQAVLDPLCVAVVNINPESRVKVAAGAAPPKLMQQGWRVFLVKVTNEAGITPRLSVSSPNAAPLYQQSKGGPEPVKSVKPSDVPDRWLDMQMFDQQPMNAALSGLKLEYRVIQLFSRDVGKREAKLAFDIGQGTQDLGFRNELNVLFESEPAVKVTLKVLDADGKTPTMGQFIFRDAKGRVYPARSRRLAPDFFFHDQVYRFDGESIDLPPGSYDVTYSRGPEYKILHRKVDVPSGKTESKESFTLERWIELSKFGWYSGDHHIHGAGCAHYEAPTEGVTPADMMRHVQGEDLNVGCVLTWGPCWYFQKQYFEGKTSALSTKQNLMRYDVEVSGFPSSHAGHVCLLRLTDDDYPGSKRIEDWPSWDIPVLKWAKSQGAVVGFAHSGSGLAVPEEVLPSFMMPKFDGIGANEYIVDVTHDTCDFISAVDTPIVWELSIWYHTLNCGYTTRISGETDFPCITGERVGLGRAYVKLNGEKDQALNYDAWVQGIRDGRSYCSDGLTHLFDFNINGLGVGEVGADDRTSLVSVKSGETLKIAVKAAVLLEEKPREDIRRRPLDQKPLWHAERARIGETRTVEAQLVVNGKVVDRKPVNGDGSVQDVTFDYAPADSSWIALRIFPAAHTNPIFVEVDGKPIRASKRSAEWCLKGVDVCWNAKQNNIRPAERNDAKKSYEFAKDAYRKRLAEARGE